MVRFKIGIIIMKHASQCGVDSNVNKSTNVIINTLVQYFTMVTSFQMEKKAIIVSK